MRHILSIICTFLRDLMIVANIIPRVPQLLVLLLLLLLLTKFGFQLILVLEIDVHVFWIICLILTILQYFRFV
jgi:hypothetical protein